MGLPDDQPEDAPFVVSDDKRYFSIGEALCWIKWRRTLPLEDWPDDAQKVDLLARLSDGTVSAVGSLHEGGRRKRIDPDQWLAVHPDELDELESTVLPDVTQGGGFGEPLPRIWNVGILRHTEEGTGLEDVLPEQKQPAKKSPQRHPPRSKQGRTKGTYWLDLLKFIEQKYIADQDPELETKRALRKDFEKWAKRHGRLYDIPAKSQFNVAVGEAIRQVLDRNSDS